MRRPLRGPEFLTGTPTRTRQRVITGAAFLAVAGLGAAYLQALRPPSAYAATACTVGAGSVVSSVADLTSALAAVNIGTCDTITMSQNANLAGVDRDTLPEVDLEALSGSQHLQINGNDARMSGTGANGARGLVIRLGWDDTLEITDLSMSQMNATGVADSKGGALSITGEVNVGGQAQVALSGMNFSSNTAVAGGDLYLHNVEFVMDASVTSNPVATQDGGSIYSVDSDVSLSEFSSNGGKSNRNGGAIHIVNGTLTVDTSVFGLGYSKGSGSAVFADNADVAVSTATFWGNESSQSSYLSPVGAALYVKDAPVSLDFTSFVDNQTDHGTISGIRISAPGDPVSLKAVLIGTPRFLSGGRTTENCAIDSSGTTVSYSVSDDASCSFETYDNVATPSHSKDSVTTLVNSSDMSQQNVNSCYPWTRSYLPKSTSWAINGPSSDLGTGVTEDVWGVPRTAPFTIGSRQRIDAPTFTAPLIDNFPDGAIGVSYPAQTVTATNGPRIEYFSSPFVPGLGINGCTGEFTGTPTTGGSYAVTITAHGPGGVTASTVQNFVISQGPVITAGPSPTGRIGTPYTSSFTVAGYPTPTVSLLSGSLPPELSLNPNGTVSGTPTSLGSYTFTVRASNSVSTADRQATIVIGKMPPAFSSESAPVSATFGVSYVYSFAATGSATITFTKASGSLPPGLTLNTSTGVLSGKPTAPGTYTFTVKASNGVAPDDVTPQQTITVAGVVPLPPVITAKGGAAVLNLTWPKQNQQGSSPITKYRVVATPGNRSCEVSATSAASYSCTIRGLTNGTAYTLNARSYSADGWSVERPSGPATPMTVPGAPTSLKVESKSADGTLKISWKPPESDGGSPIRGYFVFWRLESDTQLNQMPMVSVLNRTISGLKPGARYRVSVSAKNAAGRGDTTFISNIRIPKN